MVSNSLKLFRIAAIIQFLIAGGHITGHFLMKKPINATEQKIIVTMASYEKVIAGGKMSILDSYDGLNICYGLFFLFAGSINLATTRNADFVRLPALVNAITMAVGAIISAIYFFWIPTTYFVLCSMLFIASRALGPKPEIH